MKPSPSNIPRFHITFLPMPLAELKWLSRILGGPRTFDCERLFLWQMEEKIVNLDGASRRFA